MSSQPQKLNGISPKLFGKEVNNQTTSTRRAKPIRRLKSFLRYWRRFYKNIKIPRDTWRGFLMFSWMFLLFGIAASIYASVHKIDIGQIFDYRKFQVPQLTFVHSEGFAAIAPEILFWASIGVLTRRVSTSALEARQPNTDLGIYCYEVLTEWLSVPIISLIVVLFLSFVRLEIAPGIQLSITNFRFEVVVALGFILGYFSGDAPTTLSYFRILGAFRRAKNVVNSKAENTESG